jgi:hypothetical protein
MEKINSNHLYYTLFIVIIGIYCFFIAPTGFELWDTGYIPSFSWKLINGETIYRDFIYKGPPVTIYFLSILMNLFPVNGQFYWIKITTYLLFSLQVYFSVSGFYNFYGESKLKFNKWSVMSVCLIISLLNFSGYPWPTTDGLLFVSIAFFLLSINKNLTYLKLFFIALFCLLSALTKQSFYPIPILFLVWITLNYNFKKGFFFSLISILLAGLFVYWITTITTLSNFIYQTSNQTSKRQLLDSGFLNYFWHYDFKWIIYLLISIPTLFLALKNSKFKIQASLFKLFFKYLSIILLLVTVLLCFSYNVLIASRIGFLCCISSLFYLIEYNLESFKKYSVVILLLGISWCASISLGYAYPIFFSTGIILSIIFLFQNQLEFLKQKKILTTISVLLSIIAFSYNQRPYREKNIFELTYSLDSVSPKLKYFKSSKEKKEKLLELKSLVKKFGNRYIVAPNIPIAHYLFETKSLLPADWIINTEVGKNPKLFITIASNKMNFIFLEKSFLQGEEFMADNKDDFSVISSYIYRNFKKIEETKYFIIYNGIEKNEVIPEIN